MAADPAVGVPAENFVIRGASDKLDYPVLATFFMQLPSRAPY
jgi:hypothetical protein